MRIVQVSLHDFRAFPGEFELPLNNGCNLLLHGENGSGKSSLAVALREFLSLEATFPRSVDAYLHAFPLPPDPATGVLPLRSAHVILQFDSTNPPEVIRWQPGHLHPLQLDDGVTPASTTVAQRETLVGVSRRSGFFDYRALLRSSYRHGAPNLGAQLFSLFVESLLPGFQPDGGAKTLGEFWQAVLAAKPATRRKRDMRHAKWATDAFNLKLTPFLEGIRVEANRLLNYFPGHRMEIVRLAHPGCEYSKASKQLLGNRLELEIRYSGLPIPKHEEFLNEARLTALAISMFLGAVKLSDSNPADPAALRVLLLDDVLIGVDLSNRVPLLDLLHAEFPNHQIFLFMHDSVWFEIAKARTERLGNWVAYSLYAETAGVGEPEIPRLKGNMKDLVVAERHLDRDKDLRAAAVYVRAAFEARLRKVCEKNSVLLPFKNDPYKIGAGLLWDTMVAFHNDRKAKQGKRLLDDALIPRINGVRSAVLNRLSHTGPPALTEPDVRAAIGTIKDFQAAKIPLDE